MNGEFLRKNLYIFAQIFSTHFESIFFRLNSIFFTFVTTFYAVCLHSE